MVQRHGSKSTVNIGEPTKEVDTKKGTIPPVIDGIKAIPQDFLF